MNLSNQISDEIKRIYPDIKPYLADRYADKYVGVVLKEIQQAILRPSNPDEELSFNSKEVYNACGKTKDQERLFSFLQKSPKTRLVDITFRGNIGRLSRVRLNSIYKDRIMYELLAMPESALTDQERREIRERANVLIPIDTASLSSFIQHTDQQIKKSGPGRYRDQLINNLLRARELRLEAHEVKGRSYLMEYWETADTGRQYGHYNSLQRMNQEVRHAALGVCYRYDFQAHSFAVMASLARSIDPDLKIAQIEDYIRYRTRIRQRIAQEVGIAESAVKSVFTSLGFGARPINNPYTSIRRAVGSAEAYERLVHQTEFKFIVEDLERINQAILGQFPDQDFVWHLGQTYHSKTALGRRRNRSQKLAWIYQNTEAYITAEFIEIIREQTGLEPLMTVHDCIYYAQPIPNSAVIDAQVLLREDYQYVRVERETVYPIGTEESFRARFQENHQVEQDHKNQIAREEQRAQGYSSEFTRSLEPVRTIQREDRHRPQKELLDYREYEYELPDYR